MGTPDIPPEIYCDHLNRWVQDINFQGCRHQVVWSGPEGGTILDVILRFGKFRDCSINTIADDPEGQNYLGWIVKENVLGDEVLEFVQLALDSI